MFEVKLLEEAAKGIVPIGVDDLVDKAHYIATCGLLILFALIVGGKQIFGEPIACLVPAEYAKIWGSYVNNYCFVASSYVVEKEGAVMHWDEGKVDPGQVQIDINYYQWIPYLLVVEAAMFYAPHLMWQLYQKTQTDISFANVVKECIASRKMSVKERDKKLDDVVDGLAKTHKYRQLKEHPNGMGSAGYAVYMASKLLNACNLIFQLLVLNHVLGKASFAWGKEVIDGSKDGVLWDKTGYFPRVSLCTFKQNMLANLQLRSVQCVMMINAISEKMFVVLYGVFIVLLLVTWINIAYMICCYGFLRKRTAGRYLMNRLCNRGADKGTFAFDQLGYDGLLLLRFIENNAGFIIASTVASKLYNILRGCPPGNDKREPSMDSSAGRKQVIVDGVLYNPGAKKVTFRDLGASEDKKPVQNEENSPAKREEMPLLYLA